ncbi:MAG: DNA mismatch repair protein [Ruminococcaceae bacterium]|nr:DNA mismatch repair protein [Oscillospiraceae bacterium]
MKRQYSILYPNFEGVEYKQLSEITCHDLALDLLCKKLTDNNKELKLIKEIISNITADPRVAEYRQEVFSDILNSPDIRKRMIELFDKFEFIRNYGVNHLKTDEKLGIWHLLRRMDELDDYINCVESMRECFSENEIQSEGLKGFKNYIDELYHAANFSEMKKDIASLKIQSSEVKSVTVGINVNDRFEATEIGLISINNKHYKKSGIVSNFADALSAKQKIQDGTDWNGNMHFHPVAIPSDGEGLIGDIIGNKTKIGLAAMAGMAGVSSETTAKIAEGDGASNLTLYLSNIVNKMLDMLVRKLRDTLNKYSDIVVLNISHIIPEFIYYIRFAEFVEKSMEDGYLFCKTKPSRCDDVLMKANDFYNLKLALTGTGMKDIVTNHLEFDQEHTIYILTGANQGGKTTVTQATGILYLLAQGGIYVPAASFEYKPVDCIYTHFPADEDKTLDLGRLGEECKRFKEGYDLCTKDSLYLLNESFSTTSFEEGYYIAKDSVKALSKKSVRTIYNTHMHKLGMDIDELNLENNHAKVSSLVVRSEEGNRSFKIKVAPPEGMSYAGDIAKRYGVTYEMLTEGL